MKKLALAAMGLASLAGSALAADLGARPVYKAPPVAAPAAVSWTGCYVGGGGGYGMFNDRRDSSSVNGFFGNPSGTSLTTQHDTGGRGWFGTVQGGCDYQFPSFFSALGSSMLIGAFADGDWGSIKGTDNIDGVTFPLSSGQEKINRTWAVGARLGVLPTERFLTFVSGGYTNAHWGDINYFPSAPLAATLVDPAHSKGGWFIGTGYEYNLGWLPGLSWKTEYRFADYGSRTDTILFAGVPAESANTHTYVQTLRSELVWRFWTR